MDRRTFLRRSAVCGGSLAFLSPFQTFGARAALGAPPVRVTGYGPLVEKGELALPEEFNYSVISRQGEPMTDGALTPSCFDGMGSFPGRRGTTVLIRNHENRLSQNASGLLEIPVVVPDGYSYDTHETMRAGCTKLVVKRRGKGRYEVVEQFAILGGTDNNCAGGVLPSGKWITCEEVVRRSGGGIRHGYAFEVDATADGPVTARPIVGAGRFAHEASVWRSGILYETEDRRLKGATQDGSCFYRYVPDQHVGRSDNLADTTGVLQALKVKNEWRANMDQGRTVGVPYEVEWVTVDHPDHEDDADSAVLGIGTRYQAQAKGAAVFDRMEGAWVGRGSVFFDCTVGGPAGFGQIWEYDAARERVTLLFESPGQPVLDGPDNVVVVPQTGDLFLCEDSAPPQYVRGLTLDGELYDFARSVSNTSEFAGACFDPDGHTMYLNQYGLRGDLPNGPPGMEGGPPQGGVTYAIYGPFHKRRGDRPRG